ncbi:MAG TPA: hypothetical protein VK589_07095 [Chryseolinea sp.]|nr:hypothetical protein [Chryseolinea sp.]
MKFSFTPIRSYYKLFVTGVASRVGLFLIEHKFGAVQNNKLTQSGIFDSVKVIVLARLAWVTQSAYYLTNSPLWLPSIPIAHRKLII